MIVLHALLLSSLLLSAISAPNLPRALARINEARARALTNRARARASSARIMSHLPTRASPRNKRQHLPEDVEEIVGHSADVEQEDPVLLHICSIEEDDEVPRSSGINGIPHLEDAVFHTFPRSEDYVFTGRSQPESDSHILRSFSSTDETQMEDSLDKVLEELMEARDTLTKIEEGTERSEGTKSANDQSDDTERGADADAHHHYHSHQHSIIHGHGRLPIPQAQIIVPGFHTNINQNQGLQNYGHGSQFVPSIGGGVLSHHGSGISSSHGTTITNVHHNQGLQNFGHESQFLPQGGVVLPSVGVGGAGISTSHSTTISDHHSSTRLRKPEDIENEAKHAEPDSEFPLLPGLTHHHHQPIITGLPSGTLLSHWLNEHNFGTNHELVPNYHQEVLPSFQEEIPPLSSFMSNSYDIFNRHSNLGTIQEGEEQTPFQAEESTEKDGFRHANPTHKLKLKKLQMPIHYPSYQPTYNAPHFYGNHRYRGAEEESSNKAPTVGTDQKDSSKQNEEIASESNFDRDDFSREANPTIHKLKLKKKLKMLPTYYYPSYQPSYSNYYREAEGESFDQDPTVSMDQEDDSAPPESNDDLSRDANPTIHKLKLKKKLMMLPTYYPSYQSSYGNYYNKEAEDESFNQDSTVSVDREDDSSPLNSNDDSSRDAIPTIHKLKLKKKLKMLPAYYPSYQPSYGNYYREAEGTEKEGLNLSTIREEETDSSAPSEQNENFQRESTFDPFNQKDEVMDFLSKHQFRQTLPLHYTDNSVKNADPTIHKLKRKKEMKMLPQYYPSQPTYNKRPNLYPNYYYRGAEDEEKSVASPYLLRFPTIPSENDFFKYKRSVGKHLDEILEKERKIVETLQTQSKNDKDLQLVADIGNRTITDLENRRKRITKRSIPLMRLISDPEVRLNVPQTIENFGTATKNVFEDERAPMYHLKNLMGSSKNALLSAMRIPPQNMIIPSDYEIVRSGDRVGAINPSLRHKSKHDQDDSLGFSSTFRRVGEMLRESIKSGQETASHIGDAAHEARRVLHSARHSAPRLIIPYSQIPAIHDPRRRTPSKAILITPRILDLTQDRSEKRFADSKANFIRLGHLMDAVGLSKPHAKSLQLQKIIFEPRRPHQAKVDRNLARLYSRFRENVDDDNTVGEAVSTLEDAKISVGAKNLRDLLLTMRNELTSVRRNAPEQRRNMNLKRKMKKQQETKEMGTFIENLFDGSEEVPKNETVGDQLHLAPELLHPFMGRPSESELHNFFHDNGNEEAKVESRFKESSPSDHYQQNHDSHRNDSNLGYVLGAINPMMFERMYNQTVKINNESESDPESLFSRSLEESTDSTVGTIALHGPMFEPFGPMLKPFMGEPQPKTIEKFLESYNESEDAVDEEGD